MKPLRWVRATDDKVLGGVAGGMARALEMQPWVMRLIWVVLGLATMGVALLLYICCVIALPREDRQDTAREKMILGVCARIDARGDMEVGLARLIALLLFLGTGGTAIIGYIVLHFVVPRAASGRGMSE